MIDLTGHILNKVVLNTEEDTLSLTVDGDKIFLIKVDADCCSSGKFLGATDDWQLGLPSKITSINGRSESFKDGEYQVYQVYEDVYTLENGHEFKVTYDNESNGYYGSSLEAYYNGERLWKFPKEEAKSERS